MQTNFSHNSKGFTLIEIMITLAITSIIMTAIFGLFISQQERYTEQDQVSEMQQNMRVSRFLLISDIRMAGYDPDDQLATTGVSFAGSSAITINQYDGALTTTAYTYDTANLAIDKNGVLMTEGIAGLGFAYAYDTDGNGIDTYTLTAGANAGQSKIIWAINTGGTWYNLDADGDGDIDPDDDDNDGAADNVISGLTTATAVNLSHIRAVRVWILARIEGVERGFVDTTSYAVGTTVYPSGDNIKKRLLTATVKCRNLGI